jgi:hypothetical protein
MPARDQPKGRPAYEPTRMDGKGWANAVPLPPEEEEA